MQDAIARSFIQLKYGKNVTLPEIQIIRFPYTVDEIAGDYNSTTVIFTLVILLCFASLAINTVRYINTEKEKQLKEVMKIMGLSNWLHWISWFVHTMIFMLITTTIVAALLQVFDFFFSISQ